MRRADFGNILYPCIYSIEIFKLTFLTSNTNFFLIKAVLPKQIGIIGISPLSAASSRRVDLTKALVPAA